MDRVHSSNFSSEITLYTSDNECHVYEHVLTYLTTTSDILAMHNIDLDGQANIREEKTLF